MLQPSGEISLFLQVLSHENNSDKEKPMAKNGEMRDSASAPKSQMMSSVNTQPTARLKCAVGLSWENIQINLSEAQKDQQVHMIISS